MIPLVQAANQQMNFPIPGQSLTNDPNNPAPFESAPEYVTIYEASKYLFAQITSEENYVDFMHLLAEGMSLQTVVTTILFEGFTQGKWDSDLMMLLFEPLAYIFIALCEHVNIEPRFEDEADEDDVEEMDRLFGMEMTKSKAGEIEEAIKNQIPEGAVPSSILEKIEELPTSLLARPEEN